MNRKLLRSAAFVRSAKRLLKRQPQLSQHLHDVLQLLATDAFDPRLKAHKLKGPLDGSWACSAGYDLRVVFEFVKHEDEEAVLLQSVGTHDEVY